jgi:tRNA pseudouridine55 synthase
MDGVIVVDKPQGLTSHDVVAAARRLLKEKRIGHTGTLDPLATGVLPLACGRATRLVRFLTASDKDYDATIVFGVTTDTYDVTGTETTRSSLQPSREAVDDAVNRLRGDYDQVPPAYSAKKVAGRRAYEMARDDEPVELRPVPVRVTRAEIRHFTGDRATVALTCSAGFYVRSFAHSLGQFVGTGACLEELRRTRSGDFGLEGAAALDSLADAAEDPGSNAGWLVPMEHLLTGLPAVRLTEEGRLRVSHGREVGPGHADLPDAWSPLAPSGVEGGPEAWIRLLDERGQLIALAQPGPTPGSLHPAVVLI